MAVDIPSIGQSYGRRSFGDTPILGNGTAIVKSTALELEFFGLDVCQGHFLHLPLLADLRNGGE